MKKKVSVITPYFQRQPGLLRKAVESVLKQRDANVNIEIIVVDDGSPVPADSEFVGVTLPSNVQVKIIKQKNAGCYPACNAALDNVSGDTDYIAFLDSDDEWFEHHLSNAIWALENGGDFYFSDFYQLNQTVSAFKRAGRVSLPEHTRSTESRPIYEFCGSMFDQIIKGNILGTSTIVYSRSRLGHLRYLEDYRHTGAEYILWLNMAASAGRIMFSAEPECRYGSGVNIFSEAAWGTDKFLTVGQDDMRYRKYILSHLKISPDQRLHLKKKIQEARTNFCLGLIHNLLHNKRVASSILIDQFKSDPMTIPTLIAAPWLVAINRLRHRATG